MALARLLFVTGKGGTGKSTVAAALAHALSLERPTVFADLNPRMSAAAMLLGAPMPRATPARASATLEVVALTARAELEAFMRRIVPVAAISRRMLKSRTFGYVTAALPGLEAFLMLERLRIMGGDAALEDRYVVVDGPASGSALELLAVARGVKGIAPVGSLNRIAHSVESFLVDRDRFGVVLTVTPEELAIREARGALGRAAGASGNRDGRRDHESRSDGALQQEELSRSLDSKRISRSPIAASANAPPRAARARNLYARECR